MMRYRDHLAEAARLAVLQILSEAGEYRHNEHVLHAALGAAGIALSADALRGHLAWLEEQGLVAVECVVGLRLARLTERGADAAAGRARCPGVARPRPGGGGR